MFTNLDIELSMDYKALFGGWGIMAAMWLSFERAKVLTTSALYFVQKDKSLLIALYCFV